MFETLCYVTGAICALVPLLAYWQTRDPFHPAIFILPMCGFLYVFMPLNLSQSGALYNFLSDEQVIWVQSVIIISLCCLAAGLFQGTLTEPNVRHPGDEFDGATLRRGGYWIGLAGLGAWLFVIQSGGGFLQVFGAANGRGWSEFGYIREAIYLLIVGLLLLFSPQAYSPRDWRWRIAVVSFSLPYLIQGLLGAQRGPTFVIVSTLTISWYLARGKRPALLTVGLGGALLGGLMLFLVSNRSNIHIGSEAEFTTEISVLEATEANEYIFGAGCMIASNQTDYFFYGKRYLAQVLVRPIPRQIWPSKYIDFGVPEIEQNAGVAGPGLLSIMGWGEIPGAAAAMVADLFVEFSWFMLPVLWLIGKSYAQIWRRAVVNGGPWITQYTILLLLSVYMVTQSGEAVIFRFVILSAPAWWVWKQARRSPLLAVLGG